MESDRSPGWLKALRLTGWVCLTWFLLTHLLYPIRDYDIWWHLQYGRWILAGGDLDPHYYWPVAGKDYVNHQWLTQVLYAWVHSWGGAPGLILSRVLIFGGALGLFARWGQKKSQVTPWLLLGVAVLWQYRLLVRPTTVNVLMFAALALMLKKWGKPFDKKLYWVYPLIILWVNLHGGAVLAPIFIGLFFLPDLFSKEGGEKQALRVVGCSVFCLFLIPKPQRACGTRFQN